MSTNQPPFPGYPGQQGPTVPESTKSTKQLFPPRLNLGLGTGQPGSLPGNPPRSDASPFQDIYPPYQAAPPAGAYAPDRAMEDVTVPFNAGGSPGNFFGGKGPLQSSPSQFGNPQAGIFAPGTRTPTGQLAAPGMRIPTGQLGNSATGAQMGEYSGNTGMLTLNQAVKVVRIPVAGKPGEFKTGILPVITPPSSGALPPPSANSTFASKSRRNGKLILLLALIFLVIVGSGSYYLLHIAGSASTTTSGNGHSTTGGKGQGSSANVAATAAAQATATTAASISSRLIVRDSLASLSRNWSNGEFNQINYAFKGGAYHIRQDGQYFGYALMPSIEVPTSYTYNLTMQNITYDANNVNNLSFYGMIFNFKSYGSGSNQKSTFYILRVNNGENITYELDKYDDRNLGANDSPWSQLFPDKNNAAGIGKGNGNEFRGPHQKNDYSVSDNNGTFTLSVNGIKVGTIKDTSFSGGSIGMGVSQTKSEAAFSNLELLSN
ncbi:hypothetical protein [Dictyobacter arantiisoli]|uniref:Uncharacterized protein n=1 Tax=Dictyobacter arantiisoli TaxID=2014874 RepID=A0A5A5T767_9CHLR|nr:hypothetical protein [Dictyobacter arantiisoli]GCF07252.1 hypothetical protein KDI_08160 [Dictyobacter arantiisoli]